MFPTTTVGKSCTTVLLACVAVTAAVATAAPGEPVVTAPAQATPAPGATPEQILWDWLHQDGRGKVGDYFKDASGCDRELQLLGRVCDELGVRGKTFRDEGVMLKAGDVPGKDARWRDLYVRAATVRRTRRLAALCAKFPRLVFTKHYDLGGSHYAYTEGQSDAQAERHFRAGTSLCLLDVASDGTTTVRTLIDDRAGVIRDPDVSYDGTRILFAWKKSDRQDDYHLYEMSAATGKVRQLTDGLGFADYEACYLPCGDILFNSTRCVQIVDCWWTEVSNLYRCDKDGRFLRRLTFDQVHDNYPTVMEDGRVIYTRWDYNDRGQIYPQPLYQMNSDGTGQTEFYGNNSWFPTTIMHARGIPGTKKILCVLSGHHTRQRGKLAIIDPALGRHEAQGVKLVAPIQETKAAKIDAYGQSGEQWQYPYPINERQYVVTYAPVNTGGRRFKGHFGIYYMDIDGHRELLALDEKISCNQSVPLAARKKPHVRPSMVDYSQARGTYYVKDVYLGGGLKGIERGAVKRLRVVALDFRPAGIGSNRNGGPAGGALVSTPIACDNGCWDVKIVLGHAPVYEDGSAMFYVPARTPVYFQLLDAKDQVVQSMRTWSTLQPGETFSCVGCHEDKADVSPASNKVTVALRKGTQKLDPFYGPPMGFSYPKIIQPILDKHCIRCHNDRTKQLSAGGGRPRRGRTSVACPGTIPADASYSYPAEGIHALSDGMEPKNSNDHSIPRFTWWSHKGTKEWVQYNFPAPRQVTACEVYWFEDTGGCRTPQSWRLLYRRAGRWLPVGGSPAYATDKDRYVKVGFPPVVTDALRIEVQLKPNYSSGILEWKVKGKPVAVAAAKPAAPATKPSTKKAFSLLKNPNEDKRAKRFWSDSYLALTQRGRPNPIVNWLNVQSIPPMLPPYHAGSAKSKLIAMLDAGHNGVQLSREEREKLACWIDLLVPYCGDYAESAAWSDAEREKYNRYLGKRKRMEQLERRHLADYLGKPLPAPVPGTYGWYHTPVAAGK